MNCPVCDSELKKDHCSVCGFDSTVSFELYPTFFFAVSGPSIAKSRREWKIYGMNKQSEAPVIIRCKVCGERLFFGEKTCPRCGFELKWLSDASSEKELKEEAARVKAYKIRYCGGTVGVVTYRYDKLPDGTVQKSEENMHFEICEIRHDTKPGTLFWRDETFDLLDLPEGNSLLEFSGYMKYGQEEKTLKVILEKPKRRVGLQVGVKAEKDLSFRYILGTKEAYTQSELYHF